MPKRTKITYPKSISKNRNMYYVRIYSKLAKKTFNVGSYHTLEEAIIQRDNWLIENYNLVEGYLPRGIVKSITSGKFRAQFSWGINGVHTTLPIGTYNSLSEAIEARRNYILSLL